MSTPTPSAGHLSTKKPVHQTATPPASHGHLGNLTSPAPRSVPSPATHRNQAGKSPFAPSTSAPGSSTMAVQNHPTGSSSGGGAALNFDSPAALGLMGLEGVGGVGMGISISGMSGIGGLSMGLGTSMGGRGGDEEVRKRLEAVLGVIGSRAGRALDRQGTERLAKRLGLDFYSEKTSLAITGKLMVVDILINTDETLYDVKLTIDRSEVFGRYAESAAAVLQRDLTPPPGVAKINMTLDKFAKNLEKLARVDKLSQTTGVNCYDAIAGVYTSLKRLFEHEKQAALTLLGPNSENAYQRAERETLCKRSGRPRMNASQRVGLCLEYWMDRRHLQFTRDTSTTSSSIGKDPMAMDVDTKPSAEEESNKIFSLAIDCEPCPAEVYNPIRISDTWISEAVEKHPDDPSDLFSGPTIDWQDPPPTYLPQGGASQPETIGMDGNTVRKLPSVRFIAKLHPPLVVPFGVATQIMHMVNHNVQNELIRPTTFEDLLLRPGATEAELVLAASTAGETTKLFDCMKRVSVPGDPEPQEIQHDNTLSVLKSEFGRVLDEIPFEHPRQLVEILPTLRQYAVHNTLIQQSFVRDTRPPKTNGVVTNGNHASPSSIPVTVSLIQASPSPHLTLVFPPGVQSAGFAAFATLDALLADLDANLSAVETSHGRHSISAEIGHNGDIAILGQDLFMPSVSVDAMEIEGDNSEKKEDKAGDVGKNELENMQIQEKVQRLAKALDVSGDLDVWVEWMRKLKG